MRRRLLALALALLALGLPRAQATPVPPGFASPNVEWLSNVPIHADSAGARIVGRHMYVLDSRGLTIYDLSDLLAPRAVGLLPSPEVPYFPQEDVDTDGRILVIGQGAPNVTGQLSVVDVHDPAHPSLLATLAGAASHTVSCLLSCRWVYDSNGTIVDLRHPTAPRIAGDWRTRTPLKGAAHDVTEVAPGLVLTSSNPVLFLDARKNPAHPRLLAVGRPGDKRFVHANLWPNHGTDRMLLVGGETSDIPCSDPRAGAFTTWDASRWRSSGQFRLLDEYRAPDGVPTKGAFPAETYCSHWFTPRPGYRNGGLVAAGWYEHGTRFLRVSSTGHISEAGWFIPAGTTASAAYWVSKDLLYLIDYNRGLDIVRWHDRPVRRSAPAAHRGLPPTVAPVQRLRFAPSYAGRFCPLPAAG